MANFRSRHSIRLKGYDYSQAGGYFVTICTHQNSELFGEIIDKNVLLNDLGNIVENEWKRTETIRKNVTLDDFIIMPNHLHGILIIEYALEPGIKNYLVGADSRPPLHRNAGSLGSIIAGYKSSATKKINILRQTPDTPVWQRGYYDRIIHNQDELNRIRLYIRNNPARFRKKN